MLCRLLKTAARPDILTKVEFHKMHYKLRLKGQNFKLSLYGRV